MRVIASRDPMLRIGDEDMPLNRDRSDLHGHERLCTTKFRFTPKSRYLLASGSQTARNLMTASRSHSLNDAILKCLHRDDPLRHTYLRTRWQAS